MKYVGLDVGDKRIGVAVSDSGLIANAVGNIDRLGYDFEADIQKTVDKITELGADEIVVGLPKNMNGTTGDRAQKCENFARALQLLVSVPVILWDERSTTVSAIGILNATDVRGKKRKAVVDAVAAVLILEGYLAYRKNHPED